MSPSIPDVRTSATRRLRDPCGCKNDVAQLKEDLINLKRKLNAGSKNKRKSERIGRNPIMCRAIERAITKVGEDSGLFFDLEKSPKHGDNNLLVFNEICKSTVADLEEKSESIDEEGHRQVDARVRNKFKTMKRHCRFLALPQENQVENRASSARERRRARKLAIRKSIFESSKTERSRGYGTPQECEACLDMAYMSDDDEVDPLSVGIEDPEVKKAFRVNVPSWRSQLVSTFFWSLDRAHTEQTRTARTKRVGVVSAVTITEEQLNALPSWAKRSRST